MTTVQKDKHNIYNDKSIQQDYASILETILADDSAEIRLHREEKQNAFIHSKFLRDSISTLQDRNFSFGAIDPRELMKMLGNKLKDSLDMLNQMGNTKAVLPIPATIEALYPVDDANKYMLDPEKKIYYFHLPVLAHQRKRAYVLVDYICGDLCGKGDAFLLEKVDGKWVIIQRFFTIWIS